MAMVVGKGLAMAAMTVGMMVVGMAEMLVVVSDKM